MALSNLSAWSCISGTAEMKCCRLQHWFVQVAALHPSRSAAGHEKSRALRSGMRRASMHRASRVWTYSEDVDIQDGQTGNRRVERSLSKERGMKGERPMTSNPVWRLWWLVMLTVFLGALSLSAQTK